jgi:hypothetical protein
MKMQLEQSSKEIHDEEVVMTWGPQKGAQE